VEITRARPNLEIFGRNRLEIMIEDIGLGRNDPLERALFAQKIRGQDLDRGVRAHCLDRRDHLREMPCPAIVKVVAIDGGYDGMGEPEFFYRFADTGGLGRIECARKTSLDIAEGAGTRASVAQDHESRMFLFPALADVGAASLLADGYESMFLDNFSCRVPLRRARRLDPDPGGLARHRLVGPMCFFRMTRTCHGLAVFK
jgi:hypothetical protein